MLETGGPVLMPWLDQIKGLFEAWFLVGYRWYQAKRIKALFPFGYGLSYTTFGFSGLKVRPTRAGAQASFTMTNTGDRAGADVAQVYVGDPPAAGEPPEQLKRDRRVFLAPGASSRVTIPLSRVSFAHWNNRARPWTVTRGTGSPSVTAPRVSH